MLEFDSADLSVLFLGGTGTISASCVRQAVASGMRVSIVNRGHNAAGRDMPDGIEPLVADITDDAELNAALGRRHFDAVVNFLSYDAGDANRMVDIFGGRTKQYIHISSGSIYAKPVSDSCRSRNRRRPVRAPISVRDGQVAGRDGLAVGPPGHRIPADHRPPVPHL